MLRRIPLLHAAWCACLFFFFASAAWSQQSVLSQRYDDARTGANLSELDLTTANVNVNQFGKLFTLTVDGNTQAQPLYVPNVPITGKGTHNVLYVATMNDKVYAFDADSNTGANASPLWMDNFTNPAAGITPVPITDIVCACNVVGNVGIESTPVIDLAGETMYLLARTKENGSYFQRLHAIDILSGAERPGSPVVIHGSVGSATFDPLIENQRPSLAIANGKVFIAWASHEDMHAYHGWVMAYDTQTLAQTAVFCVTPNGTWGGIWESGWAPSVDASGNVYYITGNGTWDGKTEFGESFLKFNTSGTGLNLVDWFTPSNFAALNTGDIDLGAAGAILIPGTSLIVGGGKGAVFYVLDTNNMGHETAGNTQIVQQFVVNTVGGQNGAMKGGPVYWDRTGGGGPWLYIWAQDDFLKAYHFNGARFDTAPVSESTFKDPTGASPGVLALSANGSVAGTGVLWSSMCTSANCDHGVHPGTLRAFDANNVTRQLWNSGMNLARDNAGNWPKFSAPLVINGKVYLGSFSNQVNVYGLLAPPKQDFSLSSDCGSPLTVTAGNSASCTVTVAPANGFNSAVGLTVSGAPANATASLNPTSVTGGNGTSMLTVATSLSTPAGTSSLSVDGSGGGISHTLTVPLKVNATPTPTPTPTPDFTLSVAPASQTVNAGSSVTYTVSAASVNGFSGPVPVSVSSNPALNPPPPACTITVPGSCTITIPIASTTAGGTYTLTFTGTSGSLSHSATASLTVNVPNQCVTTTGPLVFTHASFASQTGTFTATFDATVTGTASSINDVIALSNGSQSSLANDPVIVSFSSSGHFVARNGGGYGANTPFLNYSPGVTYHFSIAVNVPGHTYSVVVTPPGMAPVTVASGFAFRTGVTPTSLNSVSSQVDLAGSSSTLTYCNFAVH